MKLEIDRLTKRYDDKVAVDHASAILTPGVYGLLGANGAGKTTIMRMICGVLKPTSGEIRLNGQSIAALGGEYRSVLGYMPQDFGYYPEFTALDFMEYMAALKGIDGKWTKHHCLDLLAEVGLEGEERRKIRTFSGGMKQRLGIAQAVLNNPKVLVLDEPTAGLDPKERIKFRNLIASFAQDKIILLSTHIVSDVEYIADQIILMKAGRFIMNGTPESLVEEMTSKVWQAYVGSREANRIMSSFSVSNVHHIEDGTTEVRFICNGNPGIDAQPVQPNLEDLYLHVFGSTGEAETQRTVASNGRMRIKGGKHA